MKPQRFIEYVTGFLMGFFFGLGLESLVVIYNLFARLIGWTPLRISIWLLLPVPLIIGLVMSRAIASLHLEDYS
jgi:hypothetical protein